MRRATQKSPGRRRSLRAQWLLIWTVCLATAPRGAARDPLPPDEAAHQNYDIARVEFEAGTGDIDLAWQFGRACFDWAEFSTNDAQRAALAREGIDACKQALEVDPDMAAAHYYLAMNQGQRARTMSLGALKLVHEMETHFLRAKELEPAFDEAGPDRNLGLLYREAPGWPVSLGNRSKAKVHLGQAVEVAPDFPENRLNLMEAYARWHKPKLLKRELEAWDNRVDAARTKFSGNQWYWAWQAWDERLAELKQRLPQSTPPLQTPKGRS